MHLTAYLYASKNRKIMKLMALFLFVACFHASARINAQTVTLNEKNASLAKLFDEITRQTGYLFFYSDNVLEKANRVTIRVEGKSIDEVLELCFKNQPLQYTIIEKTIVVKLKENTNHKIVDPPAVLLPSIDIRGRIHNEKGEPVVASIMVKGTTIGTSSNDNGEFELKGIEDNAVLVISGVSIETFEVKVNGKTNLALTARMKVVAGEEVVVQVNTGYQKIKPQNFVGSFSQLDSAAFHRRAGMNIIDRLDGTVTGILFDKKSANSFVNLQIRGLSTLTLSGQSASSDPLIIVDNFPYKQNLNLINPNDIESVTVLKDAAATSIWGAQAGNGVIVIVTKKGKYNQPVKISAGSAVTIQGKPDQYYYPQMKVSDFVDAEIALFNKGAYDFNLSNTAAWPVISPVVELLAQKRAGRISEADAAQQLGAFKSMDVRRDLDQLVYRPSVLQQHYVQLSGGSNLFNYNLSGGLTAV